MMRAEKSHSLIILLSERVKNMENSKINKWKKGIKITSIIILTIIGALILTVGSYVIYVVTQYYRIDNHTQLEIKNNQTEIVETGKNLSFTTFNFGFGAYSSDFTFFMDEGYTPEGKKVVGTQSRAKNKQEVIKNTEGAINILKELNSDFYAFQEVDIDSDRSYHINQETYIDNTFVSFASTYAINFHSAYLFYPILNPHGKSTSGLKTLSKYKIEESFRESYIIDTSFPNKFFDLDRCFTYQVFPTDNNKKLIVINSHMSAYDEGGLVRNKQLQQLNDFMTEQYNLGNYVICGGDFNHDLLINNPLYPQYDLNNIPFKDEIQQLKPDWINYIYDENKTSVISNMFSVYAADNVPTCRGCDDVYKPGYTYVCTIDGFIVSQNIMVNSISNIKMGDGKTEMFAFSDHQPATIEFSLQ